MASDGAVMQALQQAGYQPNLGVRAFEFDAQLFVISHDLGQVASLLPDCPCRQSVRDCTFQCSPRPTETRTIST